MLTLITYQSGFGQPSFSPFCVKAMYLLQAAGTPWQREDSFDPRKMPNAKLPALRTPAGIIGDSHNIASYLEKQGGQFWPEGSDRTLGHTLIRMAEEHMYFHLVLDRWGNEEVWPIIREEYFAEIPTLLRRPITNSIRKATLKGLHSQGLARFSEAERLDRIEPDLKALADLLGKSHFLLGAEPSMPDYAVAPVLGAIMATPLKTALSQKVANDPVLSEYTRRIADHMKVA